MGLKIKTENVTMKSRWRRELKRKKEVGDEKVGESGNSSFDSVAVERSSSRLRWFSSSGKLMDWGARSCREQRRRIGVTLGNGFDYLGVDSARSSGDSEIGHGLGSVLRVE
ncbi:hypothetical protein Droror1_Dr00017282 [Drosera rotundifolia]